MKCKACDILLNEYENNRKDKRTGDYADLCGGCWGFSEEARWVAEESNILAQAEREKEAGG